MPTVIFSPYSSNVFCGEKVTAILQEEDLIPLGVISQTCVEE
jgi:hypothetical protein